MAETNNNKPQVRVASIEEPERLPYRAVVYDRSNKAIVSYP